MTIGSYPCRGLFLVLIIVILVVIVSLVGGM
jgi:hypothetical protein